MPRTTSSVPRHRRAVRIHRAVKGYASPTRRLIKVAKQAITRAGAYARRDRRARKRDMRRLWITRISAACRLRDLNYSQFMSILSRANIALNRKMLSELAVADPAAFDRVLEAARTAQNV